MGFLSSMIFEKRATAGEVVSMRNPPEWLASMIGGQMTNAGTRVSEETALGVAAVYACIRLIAWTTASLPLVVYEDLNPGKRRAKEKNIYSLLHDSPNPEQTSFEWRSLTSVHQNLWGAGISEIEFDAKGFPIALWPLPPWKVTPKRTINRNLVYEVSVDGITRTLWPNQVVVFPSLQTTADDWKSPIRVHRETVGYAMALREFGSKTFGAGTNPAGILSGLKFGKETTEQSVKEKFRDQYSGLGGSHRLMLLEEGTKFERVGLPPEDAQYLESNAFSVREIARIYNCPLPLIQETEKSTSWGSGMEEMNSWFVTYTMLPYFVQWEQQFKKKLIFSDKLFVKFSVDALLRGKMLERYQAYAIGRQWGWLSPDDINEIEDRNPLPDKQGQVYLDPLNMVNALAYVNGYNPSQKKEPIAAKEGK